MFAVIELPNFALQALLRLRPELRGDPVALIAGEGRNSVIAHVNSLAERVRPGMTAAQALSECAALQLVTPSLAAEREANAILLAEAWSLSPSVELAAAGRCTIDLAGCDRGRLPARLRGVLVSLGGHGLEARVGVGATSLVALYAAHVARPEQWVEDTRGFLATLPVSLLGLTRDEAQFFADLGLHALGSITAFPRAALANRLGARGDELWSRAAGEWSAPIQPAPFPVRHIASLELEDAVETLDPLLFALRRFCERLATEVGQFGGGTNRLSLILTMGDGSSHARDFDLPEPTANPDTLFDVLESHLSTLQTDAPIIALSLEVFPARRLEQQEGLFDTGLKDAPMFYATLGRLAAVVGNDNVGTPRRPDSHRPGALLLVAPFANVAERHPPAKPAAHGMLLRRFRPALPATVELTDAKPSYLMSEPVVGPVRVLRTQFRSSGEWWSPEAWAREEWDVEIGAGLYRLLYIPEGWFVEGIYD